MKLLFAFCFVGIVEICIAQEKTEEKAKENKGEKRQISLSHNRKLMDYLVQNSDDVVETIHKGGPGSTELLSQVAGATLGSLTQSWFRCSRQFGVSRDTMMNVGRFVSHTSPDEACAMSCFMEESRLVSNGKLNTDMMSIAALLFYGDDQDVHKFNMDVVKFCNKELPSIQAQSCKSTAYVDCLLSKAKNADFYSPWHILEAFSSPYVMELTV